MSYIYINEQGSHVEADGGRCVIVLPDGMKRMIPIETIEYVSLFGNINISVPAMQMFMKNKIPVTLYSRSGSYFGRIMPNENCNIIRQRKQFKLSGETEFSLELSKRIIRAKVNNQRVVLKRYKPRAGSEEVDNIVEQIKIVSRKIKDCTSIEQLMGYEGTIAKYYFAGLSKCIYPDFKFNGRSRRPPKDEFNSMISLGYALIMNEIYGAIEGKGLNVYAGFLHQDRERHPTVASDLMEEWRSVIVDSMVMSLINGREVLKDGFIRRDNGVFLKDETFKVFIKKYESKMRTDMSYLNHDSGRMSFRKALWIQASKLAKAIDEEDYTIYEPICIK